MHMQIHMSTNFVAQTREEVTASEKVHDEVELARCLEGWAVTGAISFGGGEEEGEGLGDLHSGVSK